MAQETKRDKFVRLAENRTNKILDTLQLLGNCSNQNAYEYSKKDIDDAVHNWVFNGNDIPKAKELTKLGLPSMSSIMKYYESWRTPFVIYKKIYDEANRNKQ